MCFLLYTLRFEPLANSVRLFQLGQHDSRLELLTGSSVSEMKVLFDFVISKEELFVFRKNDNCLPDRCYPYPV